MNLLLLQPRQRLSDGRYRITGRCFEHICKRLRLSQGDSLRAGRLDGELGIATIDAMETDSLVVAFAPTGEPPAATDIILLLALPRPKMLKRILVDATSLGVKHLVLVNSYKVEKSYWSTPELHADLLHEKLLLGLEQAGDTRVPTIHLEKRFKPFVEDRLEALASGRRRLLAHPHARHAMPSAIDTAAILAIGPEGGWTDYEHDCLVASGFEPHTVGQRILRVETAVAALLGRLLAP